MKIEMITGIVLFILMCITGAIDIHSRKIPLWCLLIGAADAVAGLIEEALKGDKLKLFRTVTEANLFLSGDTVKANLIMLEAEAKIKKLEMTIKEGELSSSRAAVEHEAKLQALALESKNMKQKGVVESIKIVPVIGTLFGLVAGFFSGIFG